MAVELELTPIGSGFNRSLINTNFQRIEEALEDAVSRSGSSPNMMGSDLDLNSNDLLNAGVVEAERLVVDGEEFLPEGVTAKGDPGDAATISVGSVTTGAAGSSVIVTNSGTESAAVLNFTIPKGDTGASGAGSGDMVAAQNLNDVASKPTAFANIKQAATESATGVVELATTTEAATGTDTTRVVTPAGLTAFLAANPSSLNVQRFTANGTWTKPSTGTYAYVFGWGGGGSGGRTGTAGSRQGGGGGGGAYAEGLFLLSNLASTVAVTVGAGGAARTSGQAVGEAGGNTTFGSHLTAYGGGGGGSYVNANGGAGGGTFAAGTSGSSSGGTQISAIDIMSGYGGENGAPGGPALGDGGGGGGGGIGAGGSSNRGAGGGGGSSGSASAGGAGGTSKGGGGAGGAGGNNSGTAATSGSAPGGGGGGAAISNSGAGGRGELCVIVF